MNTRVGLYNCISLSPSAHSCPFLTPPSRRNPLPSALYMQFSPETALGESSAAASSFSNPAVSLGLASLDLLAAFDTENHCLVEITIFASVAPFSFSMFLFHSLLITSLMCPHKYWFLRIRSLGAFSYHFFWSNPPLKVNTLTCPQISAFSAA